MSNEGLLIEANQRATGMLISSHTRAFIEGNPSGKVTEWMGWSTERYEAHPVQIIPSVLNQYRRA